MTRYKKIGRMLAAWMIRESMAMIIIALAAVWAPAWWSVRLWGTDGVLAVVFVLTTLATAFAAARNEEEQRKEARSDD